MNRSPTALLQDFISKYDLRQPDGVVRFRARVSFIEGDTRGEIFSEILIVSLPDQMVIYVLEFFDEEYRMPDMYSTATYWLEQKEKALEVKAHVSDSKFIICISPLKL